ncbi:MAG: ribonuclease HI [Cyanobacteria bacterium P01_H01_bin.162]
MTPKDQLIQELDGVSDSLTAQVLDFLRFLKAKPSSDVAASSPSVATPVPKKSAKTADTAKSASGLPIIKAIYTDGACSGNPGPGGWGTVLYLADGLQHELGGADRATTNNRMEMQAAIAGLQLLVASGQTTPVELYTDSEYVKKGITQWIAGWKRRGWQTAAKKPVLNKDLWQQLDAVNHAVAQQTGAPVQWIYVRGHAGNEGNERCDTIARAFSLNRDVNLTQHPAAIAWAKSDASNV